MTASPSHRLLLLTVSVMLSWGTFNIRVRAAAGDVDFSFDPGTGVNGAVHADAVKPDGKVIPDGVFIFPFPGGTPDRSFRIRGSTSPAPGTLMRFTCSKPVVVTDANPAGSPSKSQVLPGHLAMTRTASHHENL